MLDDQESWLVRFMINKLPLLPDYVGFNSVLLIAKESMATEHLLVDLKKCRNKHILSKNVYSSDRFAFII